MNDDMLLRSGKRKKNSYQTNNSEKISKDKSVEYSPYRDPSNIVFDSDSEEAMEVSQEGAWGGIREPDNPPNETASVRSFNSPCPWVNNYNDNEIRQIVGLPTIAPPATREAAMLLENIRSIPTTLNNGNIPPTTIGAQVLTGICTANSVIKSSTTTTTNAAVSTVQSSYPLQYRMPFSSQPLISSQLTTSPYLNAALGLDGGNHRAQRMSAFPPLQNNAESRTDKLLIDLMNKLDMGFSNLNNNLRAATNLQHAPTVPVATTNSEFFQEGVPPPRPNIPNNGSDDSIARLERLVSGLANQVQSLSQRVNSNTMHSTIGLNEPEPNQNQNLSQPFYANNNQSRYRIWPNKWKIRYDGDNIKLAIEFFLHQVSILKESNDVMWEQVITSFPLFLEGDASKWFYRYHRNQTSPLTWDQLKTDMIAQFKGVDSEESLWCKMANRRQGERETFDKYYNCLLDLQDRVDRRFSDEEMIGILRQNIKYDIKKCLVSFNTIHLSEFVKKCRQTDQLLHPHLYIDHVPYNRKVSELANDLKVEELSPSVDALSTRRPQNHAFMENIICWNCDKKGHYWDLCQSEERNKFCYRCGYKNVTCFTCPTCSSNFRHLTRTSEPPPPSAPPMEDGQYH